MLADGGVCLVEPGACTQPPGYTEDLSSCAPAADDYLPRVAMSTTDAWPACISDDNVYHPINPSIGSVARVAAFEDIRKRLWACDQRPDPTAFVDARVLYATDQGLDSRVQRRADVHLPPPPGGQTCADVGIPAQFPEYCVGPNKLLPILNDAFAAGAQGTAPRIQAARIEAALIWFMYLSALSEVMSATQRAQDVDSCWAYCSGGAERDQPVGLPRYVRPLAPETNERLYDATLAVRCWRNLDNETGIATNLALRDRAFGQLDRALIRGVALIARQKLSELTCTSGEIREARFVFLQTLLPFLDRAARERDPARADVLKAQAAAANAGAVDVTAATAAIDALFPCP
jgi:hypothetical protein